MEFIFHGNAVAGDASVHAFGRAFSRQVFRSMLWFCHQFVQLSVEGLSRVGMLFWNMGSHKIIELQYMYYVHIYIFSN